jgi:Spx/MgsR family transcriptional regulator
MTVKFYEKPTCTSCRKARALLEGKGVAMKRIDLNQGLSVEELDRLIGDRDYKLFLNTRNVLYRERDMKRNPPNRAQALRLMSENPNLIKRPVTVVGRRIILGFAADELAALGN